MVLRLRPTSHPCVERLETCPLRHCEQPMAGRLSRLERKGCRSAPPHEALRLPKLDPPCCTEMASGALLQLSFLVVGGTVEIHV